MDHLAAERRRCVASDAARKRASYRYSLQGQPVPPAYLRRETEEFDARHGLRRGRRMYAGSSSRAGRSGSGEGRSGSGEGSSSRHSPLQPRRLLLEEAFEDYDPAAFGDAIGPEDFVSDDIFEHVSGVVRQRSVNEERELEKRRRIDTVCDEVLLEQGIHASLQQKEKAAEWATEKMKQEEVYVDLDPDE